MAKSLADELLELGQAKTDFDIEDDGLRVESDNEKSNSEDESTKTHYVPMTKSNLRKNQPKNIYGGKVSSRSEIYDGSSDGGSEVSEEGSESEDAEPSKSEAESESESESEQESENGDEESESGVSLDNYSSEDDNQPSDTEQDDEHKRSKLKSFITQERQTIGKRIAQSNINDSLKGFSVINQNNFFDKLIDSRIKLQKGLSKSNMLPVDSNTSKPFKTSDTKDLIKQVESQCFNLLDNVMKLRNKLYEKDSINAVELPKKRKFEDYVNAGQNFDSNLAEFRATILNKWSNKVVNSSGSNALNAGKFKVINQSAEQQVINNLNDIERLKKRTRLNRSSLTPLGYVNKDEQPVESEEENPDIPKTTVKNDRNEIEQIFDDEDFYRVLLNDLVDKKIASNNPINGMTFAIKQNQKVQKSNKNVDTKASKGRKLRFNVQDPIAHFETPVNFKWDDFQIDEFFASLLGQKVNMNESDEEIVEDHQIIENDSIRLFG